MLTKICVAIWNHEANTPRCGQHFKRKFQLYIVEFDIICIYDNFIVLVGLKKIMT